MTHDTDGETVQLRVHGAEERAYRELIGCKTNGGASNGE